MEFLKEQKKKFTSFDKLRNGKLNAEEKYSISLDPGLWSGSSTWLMNRIYPQVGNKCPACVLSCSAES